MPWRPNSSKHSAGILFLLIALTFPVKAQFIRTTHSAHNGAMGGVMLYDLDHRQISLGYRQDFLMAEMADKTLRIVWSLAQIGYLTADYCHHGNQDYHEQQAGASYALRVTNWLVVGVEGRYLHLGTSDGHYRPQQWLAAAVTLHTIPSQNTTIDIVAGTRPWDSLHPYRIHLQTAYRPTTQFLTVVEAESEDRLRLRLGMEYIYNHFLALRAGLATNPMVLSCGVGLRHKSISFDLGIESHSTLGITPLTSLTLWF